MLARVELGYFKNDLHKIWIFTAGDVWMKSEPHFNLKRGMTFLTNWDLRELIYCTPLKPNDLPVFFVG